MNESKRKRLFAAARAFPPAKVPSNFPAVVLSAIQRDKAPAPVVSLFDQLRLRFPQLAAAAVAIIILAIAFEFFVGADLTSQLAQLSDQWMLPLDWL
jgi:hypothetical protein